MRSRYAANSRQSEKFAQFIEVFLSIASLMKLYGQKKDFREQDMRYRILGSSIFALLFSSLGCSICSNPFDHDFVAFGSRTPRMDMRHGRVGSPFSDPALGGGPTNDVVEILDESYGEILEGTPDGPVFMDESDSEPLRFDESF
jgi:hypothetical protein